MATSSRRIFLKVAGAAAFVPTAGAMQPAHDAHGAMHGSPNSSASNGADDDLAYLFFNADEAAFIEAAVERLIPPDDVGPSAIEAGVPRYIDRQLHGAWGAGERLYRAGPWQAGTPEQGYQLPFTPAELYRTALRAVRQDLQQSRRTVFEKLGGDEQDRYLTELQNGDRDLAGVPAKVFFESLLAMTIEGYFGDPVYGGNLGMQAWRMIGFPGAYASYYHQVDDHGMRYDAPPVSLAQSGSGRVHLMPDIPADVGNPRTGGR